MALSLASIILPDRFYFATTTNLIGFGKIRGLSLSYDIENPINFAFKMIFSGMRELADSPQVFPCPTVESGGKPPHSITETIETAMRAKVVKSTGIKVE